jgi:hypothetical protein
LLTLFLDKAEKSSVSSKKISAGSAFASRDSKTGFYPYIKAQVDAPIEATIDTLVEEHIKLLVKNGIVSYNDKGYIDYTKLQEWVDDVSTSKKTTSFLLAGQVANGNIRR